jgi:predicted nucleic acid-binding protein
LLDTNVVSEILRASPALGVVQWLNRRFPDCAISSVTIWEFSVGVTLLPPGRRRDALETATARIIRRLAARVYSFDAPAARAAARLAEHARALGMAVHKIPERTADIQIAGIADAYGLELATRNISDFQGLGLSVVNPWEPPAD